MKKIKIQNVAKSGWLVLICMACPIISSGQTNLTIETAIKVEFPTVSTNAYMLEKSTNLVDWATAWFGGRWMAGSGSPMSQFFEIEDEQQYFRVQTVPRPNVVNYTIPEANAPNVDPTITNLVVAFTTDMNTNAISFPGLSVLGENPFADERTFGSWLDTRTYTREMALQTNTQYHAEFIFYTTNDIPALPLVLNFKTSD